MVRQITWKRPTQEPAPGGGGGVGSPTRRSPMEEPARVARGRQLRRRGPCGGQHLSAWGHRCGMAEWGRGASSPVLLAPRWRSSGSVNEGVAAAALKRSRHGGGGEGVSAWQQWQQWRSPSGGGDDGVLAVAACALVASLMAVRRRQHAREMKFCEVI
jgi:hypothetical protein